MILLDTNVLSEWMKPAPDARVLAWLDDQSGAHLFVSSVAKAEIDAGIAVLPPGKRKNALKNAAEILFEPFASRCLALDCEAAVEYARVLSTSKRLGRPVSVEDAQIAAIAYRYSLGLATRNLSDFDFLDDLRLLNPWEYDP
jgi:predicted nucleic acid-binding protein